MSICSLKIDDLEFPISAEYKNFWEVHCQYSLAVLLLQDIDKWKTDLKLLSHNTTGNNTILARHGRNTYSYISDYGTCIICGPWSQYVRIITKEAIASSGLLARASIVSQWQYKAGMLKQTVKALTKEICRELPRWENMTIVRQNELTDEFHELINGFMKSPALILSASDDLIKLDTYPGTATIPKITNNDICRTTISSYEIEDIWTNVDQPHLEALDYWWQSIFSMWWKGFW